MSHIDVEEIIDLPNETMINPIDMLLITFLLGFILKFLCSLKS